MSPTIPIEIRKLTESVMSKPISIFEKKDESTSSHSLSGAALTLEPIGDVQNWCVKNSLPPPTYELTDTSDYQTGQISYGAKAICGAFMSNGSGTSKKKAKASAATSLLVKLQDSGFGVHVGEISEEVQQKLRVEFNQDW